jgi:hypothetical protein
MGYERQGINVWPQLTLVSFSWPSGLCTEKKRETKGNQLRVFWSEAHPKDEILLFAAANGYLSGFLFLYLFPCLSCWKKRVEE